MRKLVSFAFALGLVLAFSAALTVTAHEGTGEAKIEAELEDLIAQFDGDGAALDAGEIAPH